MLVVLENTEGKKAMHDPKGNSTNKTKKWGRKQKKEREETKRHLSFLLQSSDCYKIKS